MDILINEYLRMVLRPSLLGWSYDSFVVLSQTCPKMVLRHVLRHVLGYLRHVLG